MTSRMMFSSPVCTLSCDRPQTTACQSRRPSQVLHLMEECFLFSCLKDKKVFQVPPGAASSK
eukprot:bmy_13104T0